MNIKNIIELIINHFYNSRFKSFEKAFSLAIDINDADLFMILYKVAKMHGYDEMAEESSKKAEEIYVKEENDSHRKINFFVNLRTYFE